MPNEKPATDPCGCTDEMPCFYHSLIVFGKGYVQRADETARDYVRRVIKLNPTLSARKARERRSHT